MRIFILLGFLVTSVSCSHFIKTNYHFTEHEVPNISHFELPSAVSYKKMDQKYKSSYNEIPLDDHPHVDKWISYFTGRGRKLMKNYLERSARYIPIMKSVIRESGLPENLIYVALIESGFSPKAHSRSNAVGYWQFIHGTGKQYGLRIDGFVDERRDPILSTRAAAEYFKDLYSLFGSWHLALAAYNAGEYRINRAVLKYYNRNFWFLVSKKAIPKETRNYVPKLIAAIRIAQNPIQFGFYDVNFQKPLNYDVLEIKKSISLKKLSQELKVSYNDFKKLNPMYKGEYVPIYNNQTMIRLPIGTTSIAMASLDKIFMNKPKRGYYYHYWYKVRSGDTLSHIARRNHIRLSQLRRANKLGRRSMIHVGQKLKIPTRNLVASRVRSRRVPANRTFYTVRKGDNLYRIAKRHGISVARLRSLNNLKNSSIIRPRQKLRVKRAVKKVSTRNLASASSNKKLHVVRRGETLIGIAKKYKVSIPDLMKANSIGFKSVLLTGTQLIIPK